MECLGLFRIPACLSTIVYLWSPLILVRGCYMPLMLATATEISAVHNRKKHCTYPLIRLAYRPQVPLHSILFLEPLHILRLS